MDTNSKKNQTPLNDRGGVDGCLIAAFGLLIFIIGLGISIYGLYSESIFILILGLFLGTLVAGFLILYPIIRALFGGKDSVVASVATAYVEGVITDKIVKSTRKKNKIIILIYDALS